MGILRIIVLEPDIQRGSALLAQLRALGGVSAGRYSDWRALLADGSATPLDLLLCGQVADMDTNAEGLRELAGLSSPPAVALVGQFREIDYLEKVCLRLGLRYLGYFPHPVDDHRLCSAVTQVHDAMAVSENDGRNRK